MSTLFIIGRILFGGLMAFAGFNHFIKLKKLTKFARMHKVPAPAIATLGTGILLLLGGLSVIAWYEVWWGTVLLLVFFIPTTLIIHAFWKEEDAAKREQAVHGFMGNVSIIGLLLMVLNFIS